MFGSYEIVFIADNVVFIPFLEFPKILLDYFFYFTFTFSNIFLKISNL